jgi:hypothetical protein
VVFTTNSVGYRDDEFTIEKPENTYRIIMIGDSMVEGREVEIEERYDQLLEQELQISGMNVEVITFSAASYNPMHYANIMECLGKELQPDLYVVHYFPHNDFYGFYRSKHGGSLFQFEDDTYVTQEPVRSEIGDVLYTGSSPFIKANIALFGIHKSYIFLLLHDAFDKPQPPVMNTNELDAFLSAYFRPESGELAQETWFYKQKLFDMYARLAQEQGAQLMLVNMGMQQVVTRDEGVTLFKTTYTEEDIQTPEIREKEYSDTLGMYYLNLNNGLRERYLENPEELYADGKHFNARGYRHVADIMRAFLLSQENLLPHHE